jgi:hypothetical protein
MNEPRSHQVLTVADWIWILIRVSLLLFRGWEELPGYGVLVGIWVLG